MHSSKLKRAAAAVALATAASVVSVGAGGSTASAAPAVSERAPQRVSTHLSARAPRQVGLDGAAVVAGRLEARGKGLANRTVRLLSRQEGATGWTLGRVQRTGRQGYVRFGVRPSGDTSYQLAFFGTGRLRADRSRVVTVAARDSAVSIAATPNIVPAGGSTTVRGVVTDEGGAVAGAVVELRARKAGTTRAFEPITAAVSGADGSVSYSITPVRSTQYVLHARPTATSDAARSRIAGVTVQAVTALGITGRQDGARYRIGGRLTAPGRAMGRRTVYLQQIAPGSSTWEGVSYRRTGAQGRVAFERAFVAGTSYRLIYVGNPLETTAFSATVIS